jgi:ribosomal protein S18 acetylase RimI-like enzyme
MAITGSSSGPPAVEALDRVLAFARAGCVETADAVKPIEAGVVLSTPSLPVVWSVNQLRVTERLVYEALVDLAEEELAGFGYWHIVVEHQLAGPDLEAAFRAAGWKVERDLIMVLAGAPDRAADTSVVVDAEQDEVTDVMTRWHDEGGESSAEELAQLVAYSRREARVHRDSLLGVRSGDGRLIAIARLRSDGSTAQIEDVYTVPEARGRGHARALTTRAIELARDGGHELIFITADDQDWPKLLYKRLGFRPVGRRWQFHRG